MASPAKAQPERSKVAACDNCHRVKEKCLFEDGQVSCARCTRLSKPCHQRPRKRMGRRPAAKTFSYGAYEVMTMGDQDPIPSQPSSSTIGSSSRFPYPGTTTPAGAPQKQGPSSGPGKIQGKKKRTNSGEPGEEEDEEDEDEGQEQQVEKSSPPPPPILFAREYSAETSRILAAPENHRVKAMFDSEAGFFAVHRSFMIGSSFLPEYYSLIKHLLNHSPRILTDAYRAVLDLIALGSSPQHREGEPDIALGANCLRSLQSASASIASNDDAGVVLILGQVLLIYNMLLPWPDARLITRYTVLGVESWLPSLTRQPEFDNVSLAPVMLDTIESLVRREIPGAKLPVTAGQRAPAERFIGLCASLIPLMYELCEVSHRVKMEENMMRRMMYKNDKEGLPPPPPYSSAASNQQQGKQIIPNPSTIKDQNHAQQRDELPTPSSLSPSSSSSPSPSSTTSNPSPPSDPYTPIEQKILSWDPPKPHNFLTKYTTFEIFAMLTQKDLYRHACLLIIHRLRFPLGVSDGPAKKRAKEIIDCLSALRAHGYKPGEASGLGVDFVLLTAMMELPEEGMDVLWKLTPLRPQPEHSGKLARFVGRVMDGYKAKGDGNGDGDGNKDNDNNTKGEGGEGRYKGLWFDFVEGGLDGVLA